MAFAYAVASFLFAVAAAVTTLQVILTVLYRKWRRFFSPGPRARSGSAGPSRLVASFRHPRRVSILKPVCGLDDELETNLESFALLRGVDCEVIVSVALANDPALAVVQRVVERHPGVAWTVVTGGDDRFESGNRKVARLIAAMPYARGDVIFISDSNVRVAPDDLACTIEAFEDPRVGCVSNLFIGSGARTLGASIESLHILSFVVPGVSSAAAADIACVVGKSMGVRRDVLEAIGGFEAFAGVLAEDQAIGLAVRDAGYQLRVSPVVVRNVVVTRSVRRALDRQIRWNKIRFAFSKPGYAAEFLVFPLPYAIAAAALSPRGLALLATAVLLRMAQVGVLGWATGARLSLRDVITVPLFDLLHFGVQFAPFLDDRVSWRGYSTRLGPNTTLLDHDGHPAAA